MKYPRLLSAGENNKVIALTHSEVGKLYFSDTRSEIGSEAEKLKYANAVNGLVAKFIRFEYNESLQANMLVMERIFPIDFRAFEVEQRELFFDVFAHEIYQLHTAGFVHRDIMRPAGLTGEAFDNVMLTATGIRLIDVGISVIKSTVSESMFAKYLKLELGELEGFKQYFLTR